MEFRIIEEQFETKSEFQPQWWNGTYWDNVHDAKLLAIPSKTYEEALQKIEWFKACFEKPKNTIFHKVNL